MASWCGFQNFGKTRWLSWLLSVFIRVHPWLTECSRLKAALRIDTRGMAPVAGLETFYATGISWQAEPF